MLNKVDKGFFLPPLPPAATALTPMSVIGFGLTDFHLERGMT
jgi:hypothetical protein